MGLRIRVELTVLPTGHLAYTGLRFENAPSQLPTPNSYLTSGGEEEIWKWTFLFISAAQDFCSLKNSRDWKGIKWNSVCVITISFRGGRHDICQKIYTSTASDKYRVWEEAFHFHNFGLDMEAETSFGRVLIKGVLALYGLSGPLSNVEYGVRPWCENRDKFGDKIGLRAARVGYIWAGASSLHWRIWGLWLGPWPQRD